MDKNSKLETEKYKILGNGKGKIRGEKEEKGEKWKEKVVKGET